MQLAGRVDHDHLLAGAAALAHRAYRAYRVVHAAVGGVGACLACRRVLVLLDGKVGRRAPVVLLTLVIFLMVRATLPPTRGVVPVRHGLRLLKRGLRKLMQLFLIRC